MTIGIAPGGCSRWLPQSVMPGKVRKGHGNYHVPVSNNASGLLALETVN